VRSWCYQAAIALDVYTYVYVYALYIIRIPRYAPLSPYAQRPWLWLFYFYVAASLLNVTSTSDMYQGCSPKKEVGDAWNKTYTKVFKQFRPTYTYTHTRQKNCHSESLVLSSDTATRVWVSVTDRYQLCYTEIILHCVSVSMCLQCLDAVGWAAGKASGL